MVVLAGWRDTGGTGVAPTGTVTFLFSDMEASTRQWEAHPGAMAVGLARHDEIIRSVIAAHRGLVFSTAGDGFGAAFTTAADAADAAFAAQVELGGERWPDPVVIRVRMGIHTGTAVERGGDYFGPTVNSAARLMAAGHGGQVLVSGVTAALLGRGDLKDLGEHRLKDVAHLVHVWQLGPGSFLPLRSLSDRVGNLPSVWRSFVGQFAECRALAGELRRGRVVTLTGVGGVGKTRLALEVAESAGRDFVDGVWWCDLASVEDPAAVVPAVAGVLGVRMQPGLTPTGALVDAWRGRRALVVFDNCEHLLASVSGLVEAISEGCETVAMLATSREPLGVPVERVWPVRSLDPETEGVELFLDRAADADATFAATGDRRVVVELCRRLDGIPLAIELAAARIRAMSPEDLLARLDDRFRLLRGGARGGTDRHRTLLATLDWSYGLLLPAEQLLLDRLAVFSGSFDLAAIENVCAGDTIDPLEVMDLAAALVDKSMVAIERTPTGIRYRLLETVRQYAEAHLADRGELPRRRDWHLAHYLSVAEAAAVQWFDTYTAGEVVYQAEWDNLRTAAEHALDGRDPETLRRLLNAVAWSALWDVRHEVAGWAERALELPVPPIPAYGAAAVWAGELGDFDKELRIAQAGIDAATPDDPDIIGCLDTLWVGLMFTGQTARSVEGAIAAARASRGPRGEAFEALHAANAAAVSHQTDPSGARMWARHAERLIASRRNPAFTAYTLSSLALYYAALGQHALAVASCREALALADDHNIAYSRSRARAALADLAALGAVEDPAGVFRTAIAGARDDRTWVNLHQSLLAVARWWVGHDRLEDAAVIVGHLDANHVAIVDASTRTAVTGRDDAIATGARLDRDSLVASVLERLDAPHAIH